MLSDKREGSQKFKAFDIGAYAKKMFGMFSGEEEMVKILCKNELAGVMIDRFGKDVMMMKADAEHFYVNVKVPILGNGTGRWGEDCGAGASCG